MNDHKKMLNEVEFVKERYPCAKCVFLKSMMIFVLDDQRPHIECKKWFKPDRAVDLCGDFIEKK